MHPLQRLIEDSGFKPRSYSGRGMYGKECLGVCPEGGLGPFVSTLMVSVLENVAHDHGSHAEEKFEAAKALEKLTTDNMGRGVVVYFPGVPFEGDEDAYDESNEDGD